MIWFEAIPQTEDNRTRSFRLQVSKPGSNSQGWARLLSKMKLFTKVSTMNALVIKSFFFFFSVDRSPFVVYKWTRPNELPGARAVLARTLDSGFFGRRTKLLSLCGESLRVSAICHGSAVMRWKEAGRSPDGHNALGSKYWEPLSMTG